MTDYEVIHKNNTKHVLQTLRNVVKIESIPMGCQRVHFQKGSCKVKANYMLKKIEKREDEKTNQKT